MEREKVEARALEVVQERVGVVGGKVLAAGSAVEMVDMMAMAAMGVAGVTEEDGEMVEAREPGS